MNNIIEEKCINCGKLFTKYGKGLNGHPGRIKINGKFPLSANRKTCSKECSRARARDVRFQIVRRNKENKDEQY